MNTENGYSKGIYGLYADIMSRLVYGDFIQLIALTLTIKCDRGPKLSGNGGEENPESLLYKDCIFFYKKANGRRQEKNSISLNPYIFSVK